MTKAVLDEVQISSFSSGSIERHLFVHVLSNLDNDVGLGLVPAGRAKLPVGQPVAVQVVITDRRVRLVREIEATAENVLKSKLSLWVRILVKIVASDIFHFLSQQWHNGWHGCLYAERSRVQFCLTLISSISSYFLSVKYERIHRKKKKSFMSC